MRIVHTSDWHLGRTLVQASLLEDQAYILDQFVDIVRDQAADAVVIAGDLYDRAVPPADAVRLCDDVLCRIALGLKIPVILIAGNHDSPERVGFGSKLMALGNVHIAGALADEPLCVELGDAHGRVALAAIPYADPSFVRGRYGDESVCDHDSAMRCCIERVRTKLTGARRSVVVAHAFVTGGSASESERPLIVGGTGEVSGAHFAPFNYAALGHLHRPQALDGRLHYAGSLLKYSFDEAGHTKSVNVVEIDGAGKCSVTPIDLKPRRDLRCISGKFDDLLRGEPVGDPDDYLKITLKDDSPIFEAKARLREKYPNVLELDLEYMRKALEGDEVRPDHRDYTPIELFAKFYQYVHGQEWSGQHEQAFTSIANSMKEDEQ